VHALLAWMRARGIHLAVVTNGRARTQRSKLRAAGLEDAFDRVWISQEVGAPKPRRWIFERALAAAGCAASQALFVGDQPVIDIDGAARRGMRTCWVTGPRPEAAPRRDPDLVIGAVSELRSLLEGA
jgi:HAD superfamily hydrolase (TIGR01509 family)